MYQQCPVCGQDAYLLDDYAPDSVSDLQRQLDEARVALSKYKAACDEIDLTAAMRLAGWEISDRDGMNPLEDLVIRRRTAAAEGEA